MLWGFVLYVPEQCRKGLLKKKEPLFALFPFLKEASPPLGVIIEAFFKTIREENLIFLRQYSFRAKCTVRFFYRIFHPASTVVLL